MTIHKNKLNINALRAETPGCNNRLHLNNAGAALMPRAVISALQEHITLEAEIGGYEAETLQADLFKDFYHQAALLLNCAEHEIAYAENATRAWMQAFYSLRFQAGDIILTGVAEYGSNYLAMLQQQQLGVSIKIIPNDEYGQIDLNILQASLSKKVKLIALTHIPTSSGLINPAIDVGQIANNANIPYLLDATQSIGQIPVNVQAIGCDFLCATGRKFLRGPRGSGFLYVRDSILAQIQPPFINYLAVDWQMLNDFKYRPGAGRFVGSEQNIATKLGLRAAIKYLLELTIENTWPRIQFLAKQLRTGLASLDKVSLHDQGKQQCAIVTFTHEDFTAEMIQAKLVQHKVNVTIVRGGSARLDMDVRKFKPMLRASVHYYNTTEEIARFIKLIADL